MLNPPILQLEAAAESIAPTLMHFFEDPGPLHVLTGPGGGCPKRGTARNESR